MNEQVKRGRPRKEDPIPVVNETPEHLEMEHKEANLQDLSINMTKLYEMVFEKYRNLAELNLNKYNPFLQNDRLKLISGLPKSLTKEQLQQALFSPQNNEMPIRQHAWALSASQYMYYKILRLSCDVPMYNYYVTPEYLEDSKYGKKDFKEDDNFVNDWLSTFDIKNTLKRVAFEVKRDGKCTYLLRNKITYDGDKRHTNYAVWQKLPNEFVKLVKIGEHGYIASFNMMIFSNPAFSVNQYPDYIQKIWYKMLEDGIVSPIYNKRTSALLRYSVQDKEKLVNFAYDYHFDDMNFDYRFKGNLQINSNEFLYWVQLPQQVCYTFCSDTSHPWVVPDTLGLLLPLEELADYDTLQGLVESTPLTAILTAEAETIPQPSPGKDQTILNPETLYALQEQFNGSTSTNLEALFAPLRNFQLLSLPSQPNGSEISSNATRNVINRAGLGGLMITTDKPSVAQVKTAQLLMEAEANFVTLQFESVLNMIIQDLIGCKYKWKLHIWGGIFTFSDEFSRDKELFSSGATFVLPKLASAYGLSLQEVKGIGAYIDSLDIYDDFKTVTQVNQQKLAEQKETGEAQVGAGRPKKAESEIDNDNTAASRDSGLDTADMR